MQTLYLLVFGIGWISMDMFQGVPTHPTIVLFWLFSMVGGAIIELFTVSNKQS